MTSLCLQRITGFSRCLKSVCVLHYMWQVVQVVYRPTMKSSVLSAREFFQLTINSLLELCTHCIDGHCIVSIEGRLLLGLETGAKLELNIHQQDVSKMSTSVSANDANKSSLVCYLLCFSHLVTHLVWPHRSENPPGRPRARRISP